MSKFSTGDEEWKNWSFDFKTLVKSINPWMSRWFEIAETDEREMTTEMMQNEYLADGKGNPSPKDLNIRDKELFSIICLLTGGEAKTAVRAEESGIAAYQKLYRTCSRSTLAKTVRMYKGALIPKRATIPEEVIARKTDWEGKIRDLEKHEGKDCLSLRPNSRC